MRDDDEAGLGAARRGRPSRSTAGAPPAARRAAASRCAAGSRTGSSPVSFVLPVGHRPRPASQPPPQRPKVGCDDRDVRISSSRCCGCSCSARSRPCATAGRCRCRCRTGGCSRSSRCTPARTSATRWPPASGPTRRTRDRTCAPPSGCCAGRSATTRSSRRARPSRWAPSRATWTRSMRWSRPSCARGSTTTGPSAHAPSTFAGGSRCWTTSRVRPATRRTPRAGRRAAAP